MNGYILSDTFEPIKTDIIESAIFWSKNKSRRRLALDYVGAVMISTVFLPSQGHWETAVRIDGEFSISNTAKTLEVALRNHFESVEDQLRLQEHKN